METQDIVQKERIDTANISVVTLASDDMTVNQKITELQKDPRIEYAQPNYQYHPANIGTNDPF